MTKRTGLQPSAQLEDAAFELDGRPVPENGRLVTVLASPEIGLELP